MSAIQVKNVPADIHEAVRRRAAEEGMTASDYILALIRRDLAFPSQRQWLAGLKDREPVDHLDTVGALDAARAERGDSLFGR